jgi:hypothetical protein
MTQHFTEFLSINNNIKKIIQIGFNLDCLEILSVRDNIKVFSIDLGTDLDILKTKQHIDSVYPKRHMLFVGDIATTIRQMIDFFQDFYPDLIIINTTCDLEACLKFLKPCTFLWVNKHINLSIQEAINNYKIAIIDTIDDWILCKRLY